MRIIFVLISCFFLTSLTYGQLIAKNIRLKRETNNGIEISTFEGKPLTGFIVDSIPNGKMKSWKTLKDGITNGLWQEWYDNGTLRQEEFYNIDIPMRVFGDFYNNGQLKLKSTWLNGMKHNIWTYYNEVGILLKTEVYDNDKLITSTEK